MPLRIAIKTTSITDTCKALETSRDELARRMQVSTATAYRIDAGKVEPSPRFIAALMRESGRTFEELFEIVGEDAESVSA